MSQLLLIAELDSKRKEIGTKELSKLLGISDSAIRMVCSGNHPNPTNVLNKFAAYYNIGWFKCTYSEEFISPAECGERSLKVKRPFDSQTLQQWWDTCQTCPHKGGKYGNE